MPKRSDITSVLLIGSGPITIGQACEFDYSGVQAVRALKEEGIRVILVNSNPATVMTDPELADRTYIEPLSVSFLKRIIEIERPDALLPTMGGQTGLNMSMALHDRGVLEEFDVELIGASIDAIRLGEDRELFNDLMQRSGLDTCRGGFAHTMKEAWSLQKAIGYPVIIRPSFTLGGTGGGVAYDAEQFAAIAASGLQASPNTQILVEESLIGWKEFEFEVIRDRADNAIIVCSIENMDAMGIHTGDSITVAPAQTLNDSETQMLRDMSLQILRLVGVETGGSNVQFALDPNSSRVVVVEMNPRVSRSSALASKATGYPIAKVATKLALGYTLDELTNEITGTTPASFEPAIDYVVVKIPRWAFEKFPATDPTLTTQMKSVGEVMALGRSFKESLQKAIQSLELGHHFFSWERDITVPQIRKGLKVPNWRRIEYMIRAFDQGMTELEVSHLTAIDPWFLTHIKELVDLASQLKAMNIEGIAPELWRLVKIWGFGNRELANLFGVDEQDIERHIDEVPFGFNAVDTCAGEFPAQTPYLYGTYGESHEIGPLEGPKVVILGSGPNRIGQGIEFDYSCVQAIFGFQKAGYKAIMVNSNPETVSTDFDVADRLYFEPLTMERVVKILDFEKPEGVVVTFGGQTAINLCQGLTDRGYRIMGTPNTSIQLAEDREQFAEVLKEIGLKQAEHRIAYGYESAFEVAHEIGYPVMVRPSFVLGGRAMTVAFDDDELRESIENAIAASPNQPILVDRFLDDAIEVDVDALCDGETTMIAGVMQHIECAGVHSGDSSCVLPAVLISGTHDQQLRHFTRQLAKRLNVVGLLNVQYAIYQDEIYILEANPRCSRSVPFAAKSIGYPVAGHAAAVMTGARLKDLGIPLDPEPVMWHVKSPVFPYNKLKGVDPIGSPEMKSTGEVMGFAFSFGNAFAKAYRATGYKLPRDGKAFISVNDRDKERVVEVARGLYQLGFDLVATEGTASALRSAGLQVESVHKIYEGDSHIGAAIENGEIRLVINTPVGKDSHRDDRYIRWAAMEKHVPCITTLTASSALIEAIRAIKSERLNVHCLQDIFEQQLNS